MAFDIMLMTNLSEPEKLDKSLSTIQTISGTLKENTSIINPVIKIECNIGDFTNCNYMYISSFRRYYFVNDIVSVTNQIVEFSGHVDVLTTYKNEIRRNRAIVRKQANKWNLYLNDGSFKIYQNPIVLTKAFPTGFTRQEFVLAVAGG